MCGGTEKAFNRAKETVLQYMGKNIVHCGASGMGQVAKIANNLLLATTMTAVSESMLLGTRLGMDPKVLASIINSSSGRCWSSDSTNHFL
jgi:3-hydroxyisobutyrate dehydrogenase